jgi:hypothetical protein
LEPHSVIQICSWHKKSKKLERFLRWKSKSIQSDESVYSISLSISIAACTMITSLKHLHFYSEVYMPVWYTQSSLCYWSDRIIAKDLARSRVIVPTINQPRIFNIVFLLCIWCAASHRSSWLVSFSIKSYFYLVFLLAAKVTSFKYHLLYLVHRIL